MSKNIKMDYKKLIELKGLEEIPYQKEFLTNKKYNNNQKKSNK